MDIADWRKKIDELDRQMVELLNQRAEAAQAIGELKRSTELPVYEPEREKTIYQNVRAANRGPLPTEELQHIYERVIDVMRNLQMRKIRQEHASPLAKAPQD